MNNKQHNNVDRFFQWIRRSGMMRGGRRWVGGVCSGIAIRYGVSAAFVRALVVGASLFCGLGVMFYAVAWTLLPDCEDGRILGEDLVHGQFRGELVGALVMFVLAVWLPGIGLVVFVVSLAVLLMMVNSLIHDMSRWMPRNGGPQWGPGQPGWGPQGPRGPRNSQGPLGPQESFDQRSDQTSGPGYERQDDRSRNDQRDTAQPSPNNPSNPSNPSNVNANHMSGSRPASPDFGQTYISTPMQRYRPRPVKPPKVRRKPAGAAITLSAFGVMFIIGAAVMAIILSNNLYVESALRVVSVGVAVACMALGALIVALGIAGRRAGGLKVVAVFMAVIAVIAIVVDGAYIGNVQDFHDTSRNYAAVSVDGGRTYDARSSQIRSLKRGMAFSGKSYDTSAVNIDLSDYAKAHGTHTITQESGKSVESGCPTGRINLSARKAQVFVTLPKGCTYVLTNVNNGQASMYMRHDGAFTEVYSYEDGKVEVKTEKDKTHQDDRHHQHMDDEDYDENGDEDYDDGDYSDGDYDYHGDDGDDDEDYGNYDHDNAEDTEPSHGLFADSYGGMQAPGLARMGNQYTVGVNNVWSGFSSGSSSEYEQGNYSWLNGSDTMPQNGPELVIVVPALIEASVHVGYPGSMRIPGKE